MYIYKKRIGLLITHYKIQSKEIQKQKRKKITAENAEEKHNYSFENKRIASQTK